MVGRAWSAGLAIIAPASIACSAPETIRSRETDVTRPVVSSTSIDPQACAHGIGSDMSTVVDSIPVVVHLPSCFDPRASTRYPVVYLIHGASADASQWFDIGIAGNTDTLVADGAIAPSLWVMASFGDRSTSEIARSLVASIVPWATKALPTIDDADHRAVGGISRGGGASMRAAIDHPAMFGAVAGHSSTLPFSVSDTARGLVAARCHVWLDVGAQDGLRSGTEALGRELERLGLNVNVDVSAGGHDRKYWRVHLRDYIRFYAARWKVG